jgi:Flp pilus assembly protein TadD
MKKHSIVLLLLPAFFSFSSIAESSHRQARENGPSVSRQEARAAAVRNDAEEAIWKYRQAMVETPGDLSLDLEFAQFLAKAERYPNAIAIFRKALELAPRSEAAELGLAEAYRRVHNVDETRALLRDARRHHPKSVSILKALGSLEIEAESYPAAIEALHAAAALAPMDERVREMLGTAYLGTGDKEAALRQIRKALALDPADQLARFLRAQILADGGKNEEALADAEKAFDAMPDSLPVRKLLVKILIRLKQCARAASILRPAENPPALDTEELFMLGNAYDCAGQTDLAKEARDDFVLASENDRRQAENEVQSKHLYEQANELARRDKLSEALDLLRQALEKDPKNGFAYSQQAKIFFSVHDFEKASETIGRALAIQPYQPDFLYVEGVIAESEGKDDEALAAFEEVAQINPREADAYFEIGRIFMKRKDRERALAAFRKASELAPDDPDYKRALGEVVVPKK